MTHQGIAWPGLLGRRGARLSRFGPAPQWLYGLYRLEMPASSSSTSPASILTATASSR